MAEVRVEMSRSQRGKCFGKAGSEIYFKTQNRMKNPVNLHAIYNHYRITRLSDKLLKYKM